MRKRILPIFLVVLSLLPLLQGCGDPVSNGVARRGTFRIRQWLRYEFRQVKTFSYGSSQIKENQHVVGYEPSWLVYDSVYLNYPYELLSDLVVGEYDVNPTTGFARNDSSAQAYEVKDIVELSTAVNSELNVLLAVTDYGDYGYRREFLSEVSKKNLLNSLDQILDQFNTKRQGGAERKGVGVLMDFPYLPWNLRNDYAGFIARMKKDLGNIEMGKSCLVYAVLPPVDEYLMFRDSVFAATMRQNVDLFIVRGHTFDKVPFPGMRGPMAPIEWPGVMDLDSAIKYYTQTAKIPREKLVLEFPYYGKVWTSDTTPSTIRPLVSLTEIFNSTEEVPRSLDSMSFCWKRTIDTTTYYYEDTLSLDVKYSWVQRQKLGGIGLYGLGYAHGMDDPVMEENLWRTVADHFAEPAPRLLFPALGFLMCFIGIGIVGAAIFHWQVRYALRASRGKLWYYIGFLALLILAIVLNVLPIQTVPVMWKLISIAVLLFFPLGRKALKFIRLAAR